MTIGMLGRLKRWQLGFCVFVTVLAITLANCTPQQPSANSPDAKPTNSATLVFGAVGDPASLESGNIEDGYSIYVQHQIYDRLLDAEPGTTDVIPALATEWSASASRKPLDGWRNCDRAVSILRGTCRRNS